MTIIDARGLSCRFALRPGAMAVAAAVALFLATIAGGLAGYRMNLTPSEPLGLWRIRLLERPAAIGDLVFVCPPPTPAIRAARERGYLRFGLCPGGYAPLIKTIVATDGQCVHIDRSVTIDGVELPHSALSPKDGQGRPMMPAFADRKVGRGEVFLHSVFAGSFDSRYFGPVPASGILGLAEEVLTYAP
ncbi:conjugative transfer signal peptidase TraF [Rhizobium mesoamericanum]|uniref:conjugative transfer signal peptidase TraF n=1 Tax=Rhizobium mesoamericanum TaxID=1079800 RepID=UPI0027803BF6|nr:conjugative transfer signal peptidase TraF [Rhizobium mesoamericanum]MDQ0563771.1 conjugative transfer signal peptidase TraF [Rhizobium mesoamericanum]